jgi:hypothetical protein
MVIDPFPLTADAQIWQALAYKQYAQLIQHQAFIADKKVEDKLTVQIARAVKTLTICC